MIVDRVRIPLSQYSSLFITKDEETNRIKLCYAASTDWRNKRGDEHSMSIKEFRDLANDMKLLAEHLG